MKRTEIVAVSLVWIFCLVAPLTASAADSDVSPEESADLQRLIEIIENQQRRLDVQDAEIADQRKMMQELVREMRELKGQSGHPAATPEIAGKMPQPAPAQSEGKSFQASGAAHKEEWPGFYSVPGSNTQYKISGYAELDLIHDTNDVATPTALLTQAIRTRGKGKDDGQTSFSIQASRLALETRTPLQGSTASSPRRVTTFVSADFFNDLASSTPELRLREAYGEVIDFLHSGGDLLLGQTWSTYTNLYSIPSTLEFWGPNAIFGARSPMVRWTMPVGEGLKLKLAAEAANLRNFELDDYDQIDSSDAAISVENRSQWPDGVVALEWESDSVHLTGGFIGRDLQARRDGDHTESAFGWATTLGGRIGMPAILKDDFLQFQLTYGEGIGSLFNDFPPDAVYDVANDDLKPLETLGWLVGYQHRWSPEFSSLASYSWLDQDNEDIQLPSAYKKTQYASLNLVWTPDPRWLLGTEVAYGSRKDKDGESGEDFRSVLTSRFNF